MDALIQDCRQRFKAPPRTFSFFDRIGYLRVPPPGWMRFVPKDKLWEIIHNQQMIFEQGQVVWGCLVQANMQLFERGRTDCPAMVVYSTDLYYDSHPDELAEIGHGLYSLKETQPDDPEERRFAEVITNELTRAMCLPVPKSRTDGRTVISTAILVHRRHLPKGILADGSFPLIILPRLTQAAIILPSRYWSPELIDLWRE
ncbi:MAG: hypothetical protein ACYC6A_00370 [Armatimonadota bacterium]